MRMCVWMWGLAGSLVWSIAAARAADAVLDSIRLPAGFTIERVAAPPLVEHPVMAGFDDRGRLFVADNAGLNLSAEELLEQRPNVVRMLEDTDGDGRFDRGTVFADQMTFPQGAAWYRGALYVASPPEIWRLQDTDGDGVADVREPLVGKFGFIGNAADIHGCFITPTGRVAWCDGRHGHEFTDAEGTTTSKGQAARIFSCKPDGTDVEAFAGGGMDNPVEITFTETGDTIGTMTFYNPDDARHDALVHFVWGGVYPRKHPCTSEFKRTGELLPALSRFGVVAPSGIMHYAGAAWGDEFRGNLFSVQFNTHKVVRHVIAPQGGTYTSDDHDFLVSDYVDFHPTDVFQDADGSLLVIDTGGWFRHGCPTSQIAKPEIPGGIYRIRRIDANTPADPRGLQMDWERISDTEMADQLSDPRPAVVERTIELLAERGDAAMGALATALFESSDHRARQHAVWALARNGSDNARMLLRQVLSDDDAPVRQAAARACADLRDPESLPILLGLVVEDSPGVQREAAAALGRLGNAVAVPPLLKALEKPADRFVEHALIYALIEINDPAATRAGLSHPSPAVRRATLIALDQMENQALSRQDVSKLLESDDAALARAVVDVLTRRPEWADEIAGTVSATLTAADPPSEQLSVARGAIAALCDRPAIYSIVAGALADPATSQAARMMLLETLASTSGHDTNAYHAALVANLSTADSDVTRQTVLTIAAMDVTPFVEKLISMGDDTDQPADVRLAAWQAASRASPAITDASFEFLSAQLLEGELLAGRLAAAEAIGRSQLTGSQLSRAAELSAACGPLELGWLLQAFENGRDLQTGLALVKALCSARSIESVAGQRLADVLAHYPEPVHEAARPLVERIARDAAERAQMLSAHEATLAGGDVAAGEDVFFGTRAACSACHRVHDRGERIGPDLSKIGEVRNQRDLLEAILFPSASLARGYESMRIVSSDGKIHAGMLSRETTSDIYLRTPERTEIRVPRDSIEEMAPSTVSIMPQGLDKTLTARELRDLIAYLTSLK